MATRRGDIQLRSQGRSTRLLFRVYRAGNTDGAAQVSAEIISADQVEPRFGVAAPEGEQTLVVVFSEHFRASGNRWELASVGSVNRVVLADVDEGLIAVAGLRGFGCFRLGVDGWGEGEPARSAEIVVDIER